MRQDPEERQFVILLTGYVDEPWQRYSQSAYTLGYRHYLDLLLKFH